MSRIASPRSIIVIATRQIGDVLLVTPLLRSLRRAYPDSIIDVLVYSMKGGMLEGNPDCNSVIESKEHPDWREYLTLIRRIVRRYDLSVTTQSNDRGHIYALLSGHRRVGVVPKLTPGSVWKYISCAVYVPNDNSDVHTVVQNLMLADAIGIRREHDVVPPGRPDADQLVDSLLPWSADEPFAVLHPLPMWNYKRWTLAGWRGLIQALRKRSFRVVLTGGPDNNEKNYCAELVDGPDVVSLAGSLPFGALPALIRRSKLFVGPDTSLTHLAAACGIPTVAIYGPSNPIKWGPWPSGCQEALSPYVMKATPWQSNRNVVLVQAPQPPERDNCVPCLRQGCDGHKRSFSRCLELLDVNTVVGAVETVLGYPETIG